MLDAIKAMRRASYAGMTPCLLFLSAGVASAQEDPIEETSTIFEVEESPVVESTTEPAAPETSELTVEPTTKWSGLLSSRYRGRWGNSQNDHDITGTLLLDYGDSRNDSWSAHVMGLGAYDIDGLDNGGADDFYSLQDTFDSRLTGRLYYGYVDIHDNERFDTLRFGRQLLYETPVTLYLDGIHLETEPLDIFGDQTTRLGIYGGLPVTPYESSSSGDAAFGVHGTAKAWKGGSLRVDWMHLDDDNLLGTQDDNLYAATLRQNTTDENSTTDLELNYTRIDSESRDLRLAASTFDWERELTIDVIYYQLLSTQNELSIPLDPFTATLTELFPYYQLTVLASKSFDSVFMNAGFDLRDVEDEDDIGEFNRDFDRYFATGLIDDGLPGEVDLSLTSEIWRSEGNDYETWGLDLSREFEAGEDGQLRTSAGSYYSLFKYDLFTADETDRVRTYYTYLRFRPGNSASTWSFRYEYEDADTGNFHRLTLGTTWRL